MRDLGEISSATLKAFDSIKCGGLKLTALDPFDLSVVGALDRILEGGNNWVLLGMRVVSVECARYTKLLRPSKSPLGEVQ